MLASETNAHAWYFPEHVIIAQEGLAQLGEPVREVLKAAVQRARNDHLSLCSPIDVPLDRLAKPVPLETPMIRLATSVDCVPYSTLSALAGDHASSARELRQVLTTQKGIEIVSAVAYEWSRFREAVQRLPNAPIERMSFVHALDVAFYFIDPGYELRAQETHAHFTDAGRSLTELIAAAEAGQIDDAFGQFLVHHLRSLELAARAETAEAIIEHGFALHFLEDAFAAGHMVMGRESWVIGNERARRRHDFYNAKGLAVGRALAVEPCGTLGAGTVELSAIVPCWVTSGDGYLGMSTDASDRQHAARAVSKAELAFAIALDADKIVQWVESLGEREQLALGYLIEPTPWWTVDPSQRTHLRASAARSVRLVHGMARAVHALASARETPPVEVGRPAPPALFPDDIVSTALHPCIADARGVIDGSPHAHDSDRVAPSPGTPSEPDGDAPCASPDALAVGTVGTSLLRPLLADWPSPQANVDSLTGESKEDLGWAVQLLASANAAVLFPPRAPVDFYAPAIGVSAGLSYRWGTYLPGRLNRSIFEVNVGISDALHYDSRWHAGGNPHVTMLDQEVRWPVLYELLASYKLPLNLAANHSAGHVVLGSGMRLHEMLSPTPVFFGVEFEAIAVALSRGNGSYPLYSASPELRLYVGTADPNATQPAVSGRWGPTVGLSLTGGYATFL